MRHSCKCLPHHFVLVWTSNVHRLSITVCPCVPAVFFSTLSSSSHRCSVLMSSFPMLPAPRILERPHRRVRRDQTVSHPLVDQGRVGPHRTQQHGEASVQHLPYAAQRGKKGGGGYWKGNWCPEILGSWVTLSSPGVAQRSMNRQRENSLDICSFLFPTLQNHQLQFRALDTGHVFPSSYCVEQKYLHINIVKIIF